MGRNGEQRRENEGEKRGGREGEREEKETHV